MSHTLCDSYRCVRCSSDALFIAYLVKTGVLLFGFAASEGGYSPHFQYIAA